MKQSKRILCVIISWCFMIGCFSPVPSYAASSKTVSANQTAANNNKETSAGKAQDVNEDKEDPDSGDAVNDQTTGAGIKVTPGKASDVPAADEDNDPASTTGQGIDVEDENGEKDEEALWYRTQNPMKKEHQKLLWDYCKKRKLNYIDMLALIYTESNFKEKASTGKYYGYFQIGSGNCASLAATLKTKNKPLDGAININWGTAMFSWIMDDKRVKDLEGKKKRDVALSIFQRGTGGYDKYGISTAFLKIYYKKWDIVCDWFESQVRKSGQGG